MIDKIPEWLKNKYAIALIVFFIWMLFFDRYSIINRFRIASDLQDLKEQESYYNSSIEADSIALKALDKDHSRLEEFAREKYLMKKDNEDIYLIIDE